MNRWLWAACVLSVGCTTARVPRIGDPPPALDDAAAEKTYRVLFESVSDHKAIYDGFDTRLFVAATLETPEFVDARVRRQGIFRRWTPAQLDEALTSERTRLDSFTEVFFAVHANDPKSDDFDKAKSIWTVGLTAGATRLSPVSIKRVGRASLDMRSIYAYVDTFWVGYRAQFPKVDTQGPIQFTVSSSLGQAVLELNHK